MSDIWNRSTNCSNACKSHELRGKSKVTVIDEYTHQLIVLITIYLNKIQLFHFRIQMFAHLTITVIEASNVTSFHFFWNKKFSLYSLLLLFSCFESIFILNTDTEKKMYTENELDEGWKVSVFNSATRLTEHLTLYRVIFFGKWRRRKNTCPSQLRIFRFLFFLIWCQFTNHKRTNQRTTEY